MQKFPYYPNGSQLFSGGVVMTVEFGPDQMQLLDRLAERSGETKVAILRYGLSLMAVAMNEARKGNSIGVVRDGKVEERIIGVWDAANKGE